MIQGLGYNTTVTTTKPFNFTLQSINDFLSQKSIEAVEEEPARLKQMVSRVFNPKHNRPIKTVRGKVEAWSS